MKTIEGELTHEDACLCEGCRQVKRSVKWPVVVPAALVAIVHAAVEEAGVCRALLLRRAVAAGLRWVRPIKPGCAASTHGGRASTLPRGRSVKGRSQLWKFYLTDELAGRVARVCEVLNLTRSDVLRRAIQAGLERGDRMVYRTPAGPRATFRAALADARRALRAGAEWVPLETPRQAYVVRIEAVRPDDTPHCMRSDRSWVVARPAFGRQH